ncbi:hypothetical protein M0R36_06080 [bacterium]|jgi:hypothetical protein|nr:hypothetical protein [bacterium]
MRTGTSYFGNKFPEHAEKDFKNMKENGCSYVVLTFSENDFQYYKKNIAGLSQKAHCAGLEVHLDPWGVCGIFGGEAYTNFINTSFTSRQIDNRGRPLPVSCPNNPQTVDFLKSWVDACGDCSADYIFWDEPHFYIPRWFGQKNDIWGCHCGHCKEKYLSVFKKDIPANINDEVKSFQRASLFDLIKTVSGYASANGIKNSICFLPDIDNTLLWTEIAGIPAIESIGTDPYWNHLSDITENTIAEHVKTFSRKIKDIAEKHGKRAHIWIQNFRIRKGEERFITIACEAAFSCGIRDIAAWSYMGTEAMSQLACENPQEAWKTLTASYKKFNSPDHSSR